MARRSVKSPYPRRGTQDGDAVAGPCRADGCEKLLRRGDQFAVLVGDILVCRPCLENPDLKIREKT
jgi:hypothetical protein